MFIVTSKIKFVLFGLVFFFLFITLLVSCFNTDTNTETVYKYDKYLEAPPNIRVLLQKDIKETEIEISHPYNISDLDSNKILASRTNLPKSVIFLKSGEFRIMLQASYSTPEASTTFVKTSSNVGISPSITPGKYSSIPISSNTENLSLFCGTNISLPRYFDLSILMKPLSETMPTLLFVFTKVAEASDVV